MFSQAIELFNFKFEEEKEFIEYFKSTNKNAGNWYEEIASRIPSTNNAIESYSNRIKTDYTLRERLKLGKFFEVIKKMLNFIHAKEIRYQNTIKNFKSKENFLCTAGQMVLTFRVIRKYV